MFEAKVVKSTSAFTKYLDEYRYYIALRGLAPDEYRNFQNETLAVLMEAQENMDKVLSFMQDVKKGNYIDELELFKKKVYMIFMESLYRFPSRFLLELCSEVLDDINKHTVLDAQNVYLISEGNMAGIAANIKKLREEFVCKSFNRAELMGIFEQKNENRESEKFIVFENLVNKIASFSKCNGFLIPNNDPQFLKKFYSLYTETPRSSTMLIDDHTIKVIVEQIQNKFAIKAKISYETAMTLQDCGRNISKYGTDAEAKRAINRKERIEISNQVEKIVNDYFAFIGNDDLQRHCINYLAKFSKKLKRGSFALALVSLTSIIEDILNENSHEKNRVIDEYIASHSDEFPSLKFITDTKPFVNLCYAEIKRELNNAALMNLFYQSYRGLESTKKSDESLIELIKSKKRDIIWFVGSLIKTINEEESLTNDYDHHNNFKYNFECIDKYYDIINVERKLTEQEVIDNTLKRLYLGEIKGE